MIRAALLHPPFRDALWASIDAVAVCPSPIARIGMLQRRKTAERRNPDLCDSTRVVHQQQQQQAREDARRSPFAAYMNKLRIPQGDLYLADAADLRNVPLAIGKLGGSDGTLATNCNSSETRPEHRTDRCALVATHLHVSIHMTKFGSLREVSG